MAELEARFEKNEAKNWRRPLPEGVEIKLGRAPGPDGWAADWDGFHLERPRHVAVAGRQATGSSALGTAAHHEPHLLQSRRKRRLLDGAQ